MEKIEKLTKEQEAMMPIWRDKWIKIGLQTGETDWKTFEENIPLAYAKAKIPFPNKPIIRVQSPLVGAFTASIAGKILNSGAVRDAVGDAVNDAVGVAVCGAVGGAVGVAVGDAVRDTVGVVVGGAVDDAVGGAVRDTVGDVVGDAINGAVDDAVRDAVCGAVGDAINGAVGGAKLNWHWWFGGQFWVGGWWGSPCYVSFYTEVCGLKLSKDIQERATIYQNLLQSVNYFWTNKDFVIVCARPTKINRNELGFLHSDKEKSIEYPDGWGLYHLNGVRFDETLWRKVTSRQITWKEIMAIVDIDQRTQAMRYGNEEDFAKLGTVIDTYQKQTLDGKIINYSLIKIPQGMFTTEAYFAYYECPSTDKKYLSGIDPEIGKRGDIKECMAWKSQITVEDFINSIPLVHES